MAERALRNSKVGAMGLTIETGFQLSEEVPRLKVRGRRSGQFAVVLATVVGSRPVADARTASVVAAG